MAFIMFVGGVAPH